MAGGSTGAGGTGRERSTGWGDLGEVELSRVEFAVVDLETTGWSPGAAAITEIGAVRVRGGQRWGERPGEFVRQGEFASLVNPGVPVPPGIADLTGITDWMLATAPRLAVVLPGLLDFARGCVLVAHNAPFDLGFLVAGCGDCGLAWPGFTVLDTVMLARQVMDPDEVPDCKLGTLAEILPRAHGAESSRAGRRARHRGRARLADPPAGAPRHPYPEPAQRPASCGRAERSSVSASPAKLAR